ncbi:hypothetical protein D3C77_270130 [compost metagenome]
MENKINVNELFEVIDKKLIEKGIPITHRYIDATGEVSQHFGNIQIPISPKSLLHDNELGNQLCIWLHDWYTQKYGDNQRFNFDLGFFYQRIRGDLWRYRVPNFFGTCNFFISKDLSDKGGNNETNIMRMSEKMTQFYVNELSDDELSAIFISFSNAIEVFQIFNLWSSLDLRMFSAIQADLRNISIQLDNHRPHYGQTKWSYLQCAEKIIKSWLLKSGVSEELLKNKYGHNIHKLVNAFNHHYVQKISTKELSHIDCSADARYADEIYNLDDILNAQRWLFKLINSISYHPVSLDHDITKSHIDTLHSGS